MMEYLLPTVLFALLYGGLACVFRCQLKNPENKNSLPLNREVFDSISEQLKKQNNLEPDLQLSSEKSVGFHAGKFVSETNTKLLSFASILSTKSFFIDAEFNESTDSKYIVTENDIQLHFKVKKNGYLAEMFYLGFNSPFLLTSATFEVDEERDADGSHTVLHGYQDICSATSCVLETVWMIYVQQFARKYRYHAKYKSFSNKEDVQTKNDVGFCVDNKNHWSEEILFPSRQLSNEIRTRSFSLLELERSLNEEVSHLPQGEAHRLSRILDDSHKLLSSYFTLGDFHDEELIAEVTEGLNISIEKLTHIRRAVEAAKKKQVSRQVELLKQR